MYAVVGRRQSAVGSLIPKPEILNFKPTYAKASVGKL